MGDRDGRIADRYLGPGEGVHEFRAAIEPGEFDTIEIIFTEDVVLRNLIAHRPYQGREIVASIICAVAEVLERFHFDKEIGADEADDTISDSALMFKASVNNREILGCEFLHTREEGLIDEITIVLRPLNAVEVFAEKMGIEFGKAMARKDVTTKTRK
jgi:hypothetical protein